MSRIDRRVLPPISLFGRALCSAVTMLDTTTIRDQLNRAIRIWPCILLLVTAGCATTAPPQSTASIVFSQPPHNRLLVGDSIEITFEDAAQVIGQPCTCVAAGFRIAQVGLNALVAQGRAVRGELRIVASKDHAVTDVAAYVLGAERRSDPARSSVVVDPSLSTDPGVWRYIIIDPTRRKAVEVLYYKSKLMPEAVVSPLRRIEEGAEHGVSDADRSLFQREMKRLVDILLAPSASKAYVQARAVPYEELERRYPAAARYHP